MSEFELMDWSRMAERIRLTGREINISSHVTQHLKPVSGNDFRRLDFLLLSAVQYHICIMIRSEMGACT